MVRSTLVFLSALLVPAAAAATPVGLSDAAFGDVPAGYDSTAGVTCHGVCTYDATTLDVVCTIDQNPNPTYKGPGDITLVTGYSGTSSLFSAWGTDDIGLDFGCTLSASADSVDSVSIYGDEGGDVLSFQDLGGPAFLDRPTGWTVAFSALADGDVSADDIHSTPGTSVTLTLQGGAGNDDIYGGPRAETIYGYYPTTHPDYGVPESDDDVIYGGSGNDTIYGGPEIDAICGDLGHDIIDGDDGTALDMGDRLEGGGGNDTIRGFGGSDCIHGYVTSTSGDLCEHWAGVDPDCAADMYMTDEDHLSGNDGADFIYGGPEDDELFGDEGGDYMYGNQGDDTLEGGPHGDRIEGGIGHDTLHGDSDDDELVGGPGRDVLHGGTGDDTLEGGAGDDKLNGNGDDDALFGDSGDDVVCGGGGTDTMTDPDDYTRYGQVPTNPATVTWTGTNNVCTPFATWWNPWWCSAGPIGCP